MFAQSKTEKGDILKDELIQALLDSPYEGLLLVDRNGIVRYFSKSSEEVLDIRQEEAVGRHVSEIVKDSRLPVVAKTGKAEFGDVVKVGRFRKSCGSVSINERWKSNRCCW